MGLRKWISGFRFLGLCLRISIFGIGSHDLDVFWSLDLDFGVLVSWFGSQDLAPGAWALGFGLRILIYVIGSQDFDLGVLISRFGSVGLGLRI